MSSDYFLGWSITTKKNLNTTRDLKYKEPQKQEMNIIIQGNEKKQASQFVPYRLEKIK